MNDYTPLMNSMNYCKIENSSSSNSFYSVPINKYFSPNIDIDIMKILRYSSTKEICNYLEMGKKYENFLKVCDVYGNTPLAFALLYTDKYIVFKILDIMKKECIDINTKDNRGTTPLMLALKYSEKDVINKILDMNHRTDGKNRFGKSVIDIARKYNQKAILKRLRYL